MTRIIAGVARGRRLKVPSGLTRPTSDRVRESLFASLETVVDLEAARVLDLFAGSGALGLEALSRGAAEAILVEKAPAAARLIAENARVVGLPGARIELMAAEAFLRREPAPFDLVLMDPPYELATPRVDELLAVLTTGWLSRGAVVVVERGVGEPAPTWPPGYAEHWDRRFGGTRVVRAIWYGLGQDASQLP